MSPNGQATRLAIVDLVRAREQRIGGRDARIRNGYRAMLSSTGPVVEYLNGLDDDGWAIWLELQRLIAQALSGAGGYDALEAAADDLDIRSDRQAAD